MFILLILRWKLIALDVGTMQRRGGVKAAKHLAIFLSVHLVNIEALFKVLDEGNQLKELNNLYKEFRTPAEPAIRLEIGMLLLQHHYWLPLNFSITYIWRAYMRRQELDKNCLVCKHEYSPRH